MMYDNQQNGMMFPPGMDDIPVDIHNLFSTIFHGNNMFHPGGEMNTFRVFFNGHGNHVIHPPSIVKTIVIPFERVLSNLKIPIEINRFVQEQNRRMQENETIYIDIPQGIDSNECLLLPNKGNMGHDGTLGDVRIVIQVMNPTRLSRHGLDLYYQHTISLKEALCGFSFELEYLQNKSFSITNQSGNIVQPNYKKVVPNLGMKRESSVGNLIIEFTIKFPTTLPEETITILSTLF